MDRAEARYFDEANRWDRDRERLQQASTRRAWTVAATACGVAAMLAAAVALLTPLKRTEPYLIRVDASTGIADVVPGYAGTAELPETVIRHLVTEYVTARERYVPALAETDYEQVGAYQSAAMNQAWAAEWVRTNPQSPLNLYTDDARVIVHVRSLSFLRHDPGGSDVVQVRIGRGTRWTAGGEERVEHFVVTLTAQFVRPSDEPRLRNLNPLGFRVLEYRREPEDVEAAPAPAASPGASGGMP
jgi:type IV secretion system protein VirB8